MAHAQPIEDTLTEQLPLHFRLALSYAPARAREQWLTALALDARLGAALRQASEPVMAQLRLAWWRDRFGEGIGAAPPKEPLLGRLRAWPDAGAGLVALVDGWEALLQEAPISSGGIEAFVAGRVALIGGLNRALGSDDSAFMALAREWALADLLVHLREESERSRVSTMLGALDASRSETARVLRPLAVLAALSRLAARKGHNRVLQSPSALIVAMKVGIFG